MIRKPTKDEWRILEFLVQNASIILPNNWKEDLLVELMNDGGMGSLKLYPLGIINNNRKLGKEVNEFTFTDEDGTHVSASLNIDENGDLFELDVWKVDFTSLVRFPECLPKSRIGILNDSIAFRDHHFQLHSTTNFLSFIGYDSESLLIYKKQYDDFITTILLLEKKRLLTVRKFEFINEKINLVEQKDQYFSIITTVLEPKFPLIKWLVSKITDRQWIGKYVSNGVYKEYLYNQELELVSENVIEKKDIEKGIGN